MSRHSGLCCATVIAVWALGSIAADAQESQGTGMEMVTVTARRHNEDLQKVPAHVDVISQAEINKAGSVTAYDLAQVVPGLEENATTDRANIDYAIRGQTHTYGTLSPAVITYFNEVPLPRITEGEYYDLDSIQVLQGPQGTLFGKVTDGGAILLTSRKPTDDYSGYMDVSVGNYGLEKVVGAVNIPLDGDVLDLRVAGQVTRRDGFTFDKFDGQWLDDQHNEGFRASLLWRPTDYFENYTIFSFGESHEECCGEVLVGANPGDFSPANYALMLSQLAQTSPRVVNEGRSPWYDDGHYYLRNAKWLVNTTTYKPFDNLTIKNIFGYIYNYEDTADDGTGPPNIPFAEGLGLHGFHPGPPSLINYREQVSDELQAQGSLWDNKLSYIFGLYGDHSDTPGLADQFAAVENFIQVSVIQYADTWSDAGYGQLTYDLSDLISGLKIDAGLRYSADRVRSENAEYGFIGTTPFPGPLPINGACLTAAQLAVQYPSALPLQSCAVHHTHSHALTYTFGLDEQLTDDIFLYGKISRGYRPGGFNATSGGLLQPQFGPEFDFSREIGLKSTWTIAGMEARTNVSGYYDTTTKRQSYVSILFGSSIASGIVNTGETDIKGVELQQTLIPTSGLVLDFDWVYSDGHYNTSQYTASQIAAACPKNPYAVAPAANGIVCPLQDINNLPRNTIKLSADYTLPLDQAIGSVSVGGSWYRTASNVTGNTSSNLYPTSFAPFGGRVPGYDLLNANVTWDHIYGSNAGLEAFVTNLANTTYAQNQTNYLAAQSLGFQYFMYGPPRMFGVTFKYAFGSEAN